MSQSQRRLPRAWIYKCSTIDPDHGYSWVDDGFFVADNDGGEVENFGGEEWIRSPQSWIHLANVRPGDLIFCHQSDKHFRALMGITVAASEGYADPDGDHPDKFSTLDIGPERVGFDKPVTLAAIRAALNGEEIGAYVAGKCQATFHPVEDHLLVPLIELCIRRNPSQRRAIARLTRLSFPKRKRTSGEDVAEVMILDPIRREILIEAFERKAKWACLARNLYGYKCMIPGCRFELVKEDGERYIEVHHIIAMCDGGRDDKKNLSVLCPNHHREIHYGTASRRKKLTVLVLREQARRLAAADR